MIHFDKLFAMKMVIIKVILLRGDATETGKGQIISKALFGNLEFSQKRNERIRRSSKNEFIGIHSFVFWENSRIPKVLSKLSDL